MTDPDDEFQRRVAAAVDAVVEQRVQHGIQHAMERLGVDYMTEEGRRDFRKDSEWSRANRRRCERVFGAVLLVIVGGVVSLAGKALLDGIQLMFSRGPGP